MYLQNAAKCLNCGEIIKSKHRHDWVQCYCTTIFIDGGSDYIRFGGDTNQIELLTISENDEKNDKYYSKFIWGVRENPKENKVTYKLIKDLELSHLNAILETQLQISDIYKEVVLYWILQKSKQKEAQKEIKQVSIQELIPYYDDNFMRFPLAEEGDYRPTLCIWQIYDPEKAEEYVKEIIKVNDENDKDIYISVEDSLNLVNDYIAEFEEMGLELDEVSKNTFKNIKAKSHLTYFVSNKSYVLEDTKSWEENLQLLLNYCKFIIDLKK